MKKTYITEFEFLNANSTMYSLVVVSLKEVWLWGFIKYSFEKFVMYEGKRKGYVRQRLQGYINNKQELTCDIYAITTHY